MLHWITCVYCQAYTQGFSQWEHGYWNMVGCRSVDTCAGEHMSGRGGWDTQAAGEHKVEGAEDIPKVSAEHGRDEYSTLSPPRIPLPGATTTPDTWPVSPPARGYQNSIGLPVGPPQFTRSNVHFSRQQAQGEWEPFVTWFCYDRQ
ncbi:hypothetical protein Bbelb_136700 [Branchiostoma belcheri]|nr:hypothetical protein Bbelb_136700 [Branchiostoma belcheri]